MHPLTRHALHAAAVVLAAGEAAGQTPIAWTPDAPTRGAFLVVLVEPTAGDSILKIEGSLAGQPLHFERDGAGAHRALGAVPITATDRIPIMVAIHRPRDSVEHRFVPVALTPRDFPTERLRVDPRFATPPDSALRERIAAEFAASRHVAQRSHGTARLWREPFARPAPGRITSRYGMGRLFNGELRSRHYGVDFHGLTGDTVTAANRGVVALVGDFYYAGNVIYLDHGRGLQTVYMHLSQALVTQGDTVEAGQPIGRIGATGRVTGPHLHWVGRYGRVSVDPLTLLELDLTGLVERQDDVSAPTDGR